MTYRKITVSNLLGLNYYIYELTSSNYNPDINDTFDITCKVTNIRGNPVSNKEITLLENGETLFDTNGVNVGTKTTNANGEYTWTITPYNVLSNIYQNHGQDEALLWGLRTYSIGDKSIQVLVDGWKYKNGTSSSTWALQRNKTMGRLILKNYSVPVAASWTSFGGGTAYASDFAPYYQTRFEGNQDNVQFMIKGDGSFEYKNTRSSSANLYMQGEWTIG